ncbi:MAG: SUMF1/EgtB/PvdO family nonheme iron enzyme, partial [Anaerolineales bacterium]
MQDLNGLYRKIALTLALLMMLGCGQVEQTPLVIERVVTATSAMNTNTPRPASMLATDTAGATSIPPTRTPRPTSVPPTSTPPPPTPTPGIGSTMVSPVDGMVLVYVPEGTFLMGSAWPDPNANEDEAPQHEVYLDSFWIDRTEVTNAMYADFLNARGGN